MNTSIILASVCGGLVGAGLATLESRRVLRQAREDAAEVLEAVKDLQTQIDDLDGWVGDVRGLLQSLIVPDTRRGGRV